MSEDGIRWIFDPDDARAHVLADPTGNASVVVTMCGRELPADRTPTFGVAPSLTVCAICAPYAHLDRPAPMFPTPMYY